MPSPPFLEDDSTRAQLLRAVAGNHQQMWIHGARLRGGEVHREKGATWIYTPGSPGEVMVAFPRMTGVQASEPLDTLLRYCRHRLPLRSVGCWSLGPRPRALGARLLARGFEWGWQPHWMGLDLRAMRTDHPTPPGLRVVPAEEAPEPEADDIPNHHPEDTVHWEAERRARPRPGTAGAGTWRFAAVLEGQVVGRSAVFVTTGPLGVAGIYSCGVVPAARRQGIGTAVTRAACQLAASLGCRHALLNATPMGEPVYRRLGFTSLGHGQTWWLHPSVLEAPPPPEPQVRFVEAVGRGDVAALDELGRKLDPETLNARLPCGMTPLRVAVRLQQPASAEWLVSHGAALDVISGWDLGWKERVRQLLAARPELANRRSGHWQITPLHVAAERGDAELVRVLLAAGADLEAQDTEFHSTPLGWARHFERAEIAALIERALRNPPLK
jgi:GNAT superfamily N-acetyltransferase